MIKISSSILNADFTQLANVVRSLEASGTDMLHLDIMDGVFVPNISFGFPIIESLRKITTLFFDVHLMIANPGKYIESIAKAGADGITFHYESALNKAGSNESALNKVGSNEASRNVEKTLIKIKKLQKKSCLAIKPETAAEAVFSYLPLCDTILVMTVEPGFGKQRFIESTLSKISIIREEISRQKLNVSIQVDGGIDIKTAPQVIQAGANILVAGNVLFSADDMKSVMENLRG